MNFKAVIFDLDGTLLDTIDDLADSMNKVLGRLGMPIHGIPEYKIFVGDGMRKLVTRALPAALARGPDSGAVIDKTLGMMKKEYNRRCFIKTRPYEGMPAALRTLHDSGIKLAVLSNKPDAFTSKTVNRLLPGKLFSIILGQKDGGALKPDPAGALEISSGLGISPGEILYLGDTSTDMATAIAAGMFPAGALWGFRTREELSGSGAAVLFNSPSELPDYLGL
jgi:phosphoglycolate phosphatase